MGTLRRSALATRGSKLTIEVPDTARVLRDAAIWDVYYEHYSCFTADSLAELAACQGFAVEPSYGHEHYLLYRRTCDRAPWVPSVDAGCDDAERFRDRVADSVVGWKQRLVDEAQRGRRVAPWGDGSKAVSSPSTVGGGDGSPRSSTSTRASTDGSCQVPAIACSGQTIWRTLSQTSS